MVKAFFTALIAFLLLTSVMVLMDQTESARYHQQQRGEVINQLGQLRAQLESELNHTLHLTQGLIAYVATHPYFSSRGFRRMARELVADAPHIRNLGLAPNNVLQHIYPLAGNEKAIGLDYKKNRKQWPAVKLAIDARRTIVAGPVNLVQGGRAFIARTPIWTSPSDSDRGSGPYWGLASVVIDINSLLEASGFYEDHGLSLAMRGKDGKGAGGRHFQGDKKIYLHKPVTLEVTLPNGSWQLSGLPVDGWASASPRQAALRILSMVGVLLISLLVFFWSYSQQRYHQQLHDAMLKAEAANQSKSNFLAAMSHEIRTPMNIVLGLSDVILENTRDPETRKNLKQMQTSGNTLLELINNILDLSKMESEKLKPVLKPYDPQQMLQDAMEMYSLVAEEKSITLKMELDGDLPRQVVGDAPRIRQIIVNLTGNALKFTDSGEVELSLKRHATREDTFVYGVRDTGIGIPQDKLDKIFDKFTQGDDGVARRYGGSGLGLAISKRLAESLGGDLQVSSRQGEGSFFSLTLTQSTELDLDEVTESLRASRTALLQQERKSKLEKRQIRGRPIRILLAEDMPDNQRLMQIFLKDPTYHLEIVENGQQALEHVQRHPYDIVLMDMQMPIMDGYTATQAIRQWEECEQEGNSHPAPPLIILALTAHALGGDQDKSLDAGCDEHLTKPIKKVALRECISRYCQVV
uniref:histidine kinase n=1 Tax=Magnetococcus massalia (strain MO-1) TaxID=451514 RepID=A0A1S7LG99_MAGMO|nr:Conserved protein of unknown function. Putative Sensor protein [Candidatus Magnetococcus massalia]